MQVRADSGTRGTASGSGLRKLGAFLHTDPGDRVDRALPGSGDGDVQCSRVHTHMGGARPTQGISVDLDHLGRSTHGGGGRLPEGDLPGGGGHVEWTQAHPWTRTFAARSAQPSRPAWVSTAMMSSSPSSGSASGASTM